MIRTKKFFLFTVLSSLLSLNIFAIGAGIQAGGIPALTMNAASEKVDNFNANVTGTVKLFRIPAVFGFGLETGSDNDNFIYGVSGFADYNFTDYQLKNTWNIYSGAGISGKLLFSKNDTKLLSVGPRFFAGMNWLFLDNYIEYYAQIAVVPSYNKVLSADYSFFRLSFPVETGVRLHF